MSRSKRRDFRLLLFGQTASQLGAQVSGVAVPLLAVLVLGASPLQLGLVTASGTVAFAVIGLPAGAWVDRWRRRPVLVGSDLVRAGLLGTVPLAGLLGVLSVGQVMAVALGVGAARVFFDVGYQSYVPSVVGGERVLAGNSAMETVRACGQVAGPGLGGWLVGWAGAAQVVWIQVGTYALSAASLLAIRVREPAPARAAGRRLREEVAEGLRFVARSPVLRATALTSAAGNFAFAVASAVNVIFMSRVVGLSAAQIGLVTGAGSVAALAGAALTPALARWLGSGRVVWVSLAATGPLTLLGPLAQRGPLAVLVGVGAAAGELGQIVYAITSLSLRQRLCPAGMLGRVGATMRFLIMGLAPLGALLGGVLGEFAGVRATLWASFALILLSPLPSYRALRGVREVADLQGGS